jgi:hypothetical protein
LRRENGMIPAIRSNHQTWIGLVLMTSSNALLSNGGGPQKLDNVISSKSARKERS